jgi:uridine phosphorylase
LLHDFKAALPPTSPFIPYIALANVVLIDKLAKGLQQGLTISSPGFYAPQGRQVRARLTIIGLMEAIQRFRSGGQRIANLEMETAGIYGVAAALGHRAISFNVILANRATQKFSERPQVITDISIKQVLDLITSN